MSGYPRETILNYGELEPGVEFLEKPFTAEALIRKVRDALDGPAGAARAGIHGD